MTIAIERPNGKVYRPRKPPKAILLNEDSLYREVEVLVIRTDDIDVARDLANRAYRSIIGAGDLGLDHWPYSLDWWRERPDGNRDEMVWESGFPETGVPGFLFEPLRPGSKSPEAGSDV